MEPNSVNADEKIFEDCNNKLQGIITDLQHAIKNIKDDLLIKNINEIITKINNIIKENQENNESIVKKISSLKEQINQETLNNNNKEKKYVAGRYVGQILNGNREGKGIFYYNNGDIYEGNYNNNKK